MASVVINGDVSGSVTLQAPSASGSTTLTLPTTTGTIPVLPATTGVLAEASGGTGTTTGYYGFKNRIINGAMKIWQRGTSISVGGSDTYTADRWVGIAAGANYTASQASYTMGGITKNSLVMNGAAGNTLCDMAQRIEAANAYDLAGSICTVQADVYTTDGTNVTWEAYSANSADNFTGGKTLIATGTLTTVVSDYVSKTFSFTASSAVANGLEIRFKFGSLLAGKQGALGAVQLEKGSTATSFDYRPYGTELALCQRYLPATSAATNGGVYSGSVFSNTAAVCVIPLLVTARVAPTGITTTGTFSCLTAAGGANAATVAFNRAGEQSALVTATTSGMTNGNATVLLCDSGRILFTGCEL